MAELTPPGRFMTYTFFRAVREWYGLGKAERGKAIAEYLARVDDFKGRLILRTYTEEVKVTVEPGQATYLFVYPFVKTREWYRR